MRDNWHWQMFTLSSYQGENHRTIRLVVCVCLLFYLHLFPSRYAVDQAGLKMSEFLRPFLRQIAIAANDWNLLAPIVQKNEVENPGPSEFGTTQI